MRFVLIAALFLAPALLASQQPAGQPPHSVVTGVAVDSVRGGYLRGAIVSVSGTTLSAITDSAGRFKIDSVAPGSRHLEVLHPLLDSMSLRVRSPARQLNAGDTTVFILAVPSAATIVGAKCTAQDRARGNAALLGTVNDADTETPSTGATVSVEWLEYQLGRRSMNRIPQRRIGTVASDGAYRVCGIPDDLTTGAIAIRGSDSTAVVQVNFANKLGIVSFLLPPAGAPAVAAATPGDTAAKTAPRGAGSLTGKILDPGGAPLANARVAVESDDAAAITDNAGVFRLSGLRVGTRLLSVRRIGFASKDLPVDVSAANPRDVTVTLERYVAILDAVRINAIRDIGLQRVGFSERQASAFGKFWGPEEIERRNPQRLSTLLETAPSLRTGTNALGKRYITGRNGGCLAYFVDGFRWSSTDPTDLDMSPDGFLSASELGAVEVYEPLSAPAEYTRFSNRGEPCAVVVVWTKFKLGN